MQGLPLLREVRRPETAVASVDSSAASRSAVPLLSIPSHTAQAEVSISLGEGQWHPVLTGKLGQVSGGCVQAGDPLERVTRSHLFSGTLGDSRPLFLV